MRIGVLTTSYPRWPGDAAGSFVAGLNRYLVRAGHTVEVLAAGECGPTATRDPDPDPATTVERIPSSLFYGGGAPDALAAKKMTAVIPSASFCLRLYEKAAARRACWDAVIAHWVLPCAAIAALLPERWPLLAIAHSSDIHLARRYRLEPLVRWLSRRSRLVYTSETLRIAGAPGVVAPMGINVAELRGDDAERARLRIELGLRGPTLLFLGRLVPVKGLDRLLEALPMVPGATLLIAGEGPERPRLERLAQPFGATVRFVGAVEGAKKRALLLACDALVLPSRVLDDGRTEGAPVVLMEALAAQCPVVATDVGAAAALIGEAGLVVPPEDARALAAALTRALHDREWRLLCKAAAAARAGRHDWSQAAPAILGDFLASATCPSTPPGASA